MKHGTQFEKVGGSFQPVVRSAADLNSLIDLAPALWSVTSISIEAVAMDKVFLSFIDDDGNGKIRVDEVKRAIVWIQAKLKNLEGAEKGSSTLNFSDLNTEDPEAMEILASARLAVCNVGEKRSESISLEEIRNREKIIAAGLSNGDGVIPLALIEDPGLLAFSKIIIDTCGTAKDSSGLDGLDADALKKFIDGATAFLQWLDEPLEHPEIMPFGASTGKFYKEFSDIGPVMDDYFRFCAALRFSGPRVPAPVLPDMMNSDAIDLYLSKAPLAIPSPDGVLSLKADMNPIWSDKVISCFTKVSPEAVSVSGADWDSLQKMFAPHGAWLRKKPTTLFDTVDVSLLRNGFRDDFPGKIRTMIDNDLAHAGEIEHIGKVEKLILYQVNLFEFLNNYASLKVLFNPSINSILQAGTLVMDGRCFRLAVRVVSIPEHKAIAERSNICTMYIELQTGRKDALKKQIVAVAVTSGDMYNLFVGKSGVFFSPDDTVWDAKVVDYIQQPVSFSEALRMPFYRFGSFIGKQVDKFFSARSKEFEQGVDSTLAQAQKFNPNAVSQQTPAVSGSMMLMGGGVGLAALGSAVAFIAQALHNVSPWSVLGVFLGIMLLFGGPMVIISLVKLYRRNIAVFLEAGGLALNKRMRLSRAMGLIFTEQPGIPGKNLSLKVDVVREFLRKELELQEKELEKKTSFLKRAFYWLVSAGAGMAIGFALWYFFLR